MLAEFADMTVTHEHVDTVSLCDTVCIETNDETVCVENTSTVSRQF